MFLLLLITATQKRLFEISCPRSFSVDRQPDWCPVLLRSTRPQTEKMIIKRATYRLFLRGFLLFLVGMFFALVLNLLQVQRQVTLFPDVVENVFSSAWWVPPSCGTAAGEYDSPLFHLDILNTMLSF